MFMLLYICTVGVYNISLKYFCFSIHILYEYAKEKKEEEKMTDRPPLHRILQRKMNEYLSRINLIYVISA